MVPLLAILCHLETNVLAEAAASRCPFMADHNNWRCQIQLTVTDTSFILLSVTSRSSEDRLIPGE